MRTATLTDRIAVVRPKLDRWTRLAFRLLDGLEAGSLTVELPDGATATFAGTRTGPHATVRIHDTTAVRRFIVGADVGFAEAVMDGLVDSPDMPAVVELLAHNKRIIETEHRASLLKMLIRRALHWLNRNSRRGSRRNIGYHYDLGNSFYEEWLDPSMTYSAARYGDSAAASLDTAQLAKYRAIADALDLRPGSRVLEIGCGWGGFAEFVAREHDVQVVGITLSDQQHAYATRRIARAGLSDRVTIELCDYRDVEGRFDAIASIEMFEAVGQTYWSSFFETLKVRLEPGGRAALQIITIAEESFEEYRTNPDFIQRYIFPGGMLPTRDHLRELTESVGMDVVSEDAFGLDYARTLADWRDRFDRRVTRIAALGYDQRFLRMWRYYLAYCEGGFRSGNIDVRQLALARR